MITKSRPDRLIPSISTGLRSRSYFLHPTVTATIVIVSLPEMSTTFTASSRRPGVHSWNTLVSSSERSFLVRKDCHSFSKM